MGDMSDEVLRNNDSAWSADHCMASAEVPGVLFSNRPIAAASPALIDMAPTILSEFGVAKPAEMAGRSVFESPPAVASAQ